MIEIGKNGLECFMLSCFLFTLLDIKENKKLFFFISLFITSMIITILSKNLNLYITLFTTLIIISNVIISSFFVKNDKCEIIFYSCLETIIRAFASVISFIFFSQTKMIMLCMHLLIYLFLFYFSIMKKKMLFLDNHIYYLLSVIMFFLQFIIYSFLQLYLFYIEEHPELKMIFVFLLFFIIVVVLYLISQFSYILQLKQENRELKSSHNHNQIISNLYEEIKITKHDIKHEYEMLNHYLENKEYDKLKEYMTSRINKIEDIPSFIQTKNNMINMIINNKIIKATIKHIHVECEITVFEHLFIKDYDLNILLSNALDNAIENNRDNGYIKIKMIQEDIFLYISIINSTDNIMIQTKKNNNDHGYGLKSINKICEMYNGEMNISLKDKEFHLKMTLIA